MKNAKAFLAVAVSAAVLSGCTMKMAIRRTNTDFIYPNSNVTPLGHVSATSPQSVSVFVPQFFDAAQIDELTKKAAAEKGGDTLVNEKLVVTTTMIPIGIPIMISSLQIEGEAVKMTVGRKDLR